MEIMEIDYTKTLARHGAVELFMDLGFAVLLTISHGVEAQAVDLDAGIAKAVASASVASS